MLSRIISDECCLYKKQNRTIYSYRAQRFSSCDNRHLTWDKLLIIFTFNMTQNPIDTES